MTLVPFLAQLTARVGQIRVVSQCGIAALFGWRPVASRIANSTKVVVPLSAVQMHKFQLALRSLFSEPSISKSSPKKLENKLRDSHSSRWQARVQQRWDELLTQHQSNLQAPGACCMIGY
ncbi:hypothetical protein C8J56DRAFT_897927 [Mycena floridula]|nr:hypothetical protein C8J56DRAFT_897927 [Mycena floridula]